MIFIVTARMPIWSGTLDTGTKAVFVFNSDILSDSVALSWPLVLYWPLPTSPCCHSDLYLWSSMSLSVPSRYNERPETMCVHCSGHFTILTIVCWRTQLFVTHNLSLVFKWLGDFWMPYSMIRSLSWMQSACTPPSQDEGPWCFDLRDDCWHCCCSSQGAEGCLWSAAQLFVGSRPEHCTGLRRGWYPDTVPGPGWQQ